ncbi:MAG: creatininase family protein, partial [Gaiellales bacterium]
MRNSVFLDELTDPEVAAYIRGYPAMVLIPTGSTEQHGAHGPLGTDVIIPREVCRRVAEVKSALVAPPVPYGLSSGHRGFKGLAYVNVDTYLKLIEDLTLSLAESGFRRIVFVNGHFVDTVALATPR